jgi:hypothetical protein
MLGAGERNASKRLRRNCGQRQADRRSGLGRVEEKFSALRYAIATQRHDVTDAEAAVAQQQYKGTHAHGIRAIGIVLARTKESTMRYLKPNRSQAVREG